MNPMERPQFPPTHRRQLTNASILRHVDDLLEGHPHTSQSGVVLQNLIDACHLQGIPYSIKAEASEGQPPTSS